MSINCIDKGDSHDKPGQNSETLPSPKLLALHALISLSLHSQILPGGVYYKLWSGKRIRMSLTLQACRWCHHNSSRLDHVADNVILQPRYSDCTGEHDEVVSGFTQPYPYFFSESEVNSVKPSNSAGGSALQHSFQSTPPPASAFVIAARYAGLSVHLLTQARIPG